MRFYVKWVKDCESDTFISMKFRNLGFSVLVSQKEIFVFCQMRYKTNTHNEWRKFSLNIDLSHILSLLQSLMNSFPLSTFNSYLYWFSHKFYCFNATPALQKHFYWWNIVHSTICRKSQRTPYLFIRWHTFCLLGS